MAHGDAASDDSDGTDVEELLPDEVAAAPISSQEQSSAPQPTHRRPKSSVPPPPVPDAAEFDIPLTLDAPPPSAPASDPYLGRVVADRYLVERLLGVGSMGLVYLASHTVLDKAVALKIIRQDLAQDDESVGRFVTEAKAASAIGSEHIVEVQDFGKLPDGATYIVMEYLEGVTLGEALDREGGVSIEESVRIAAQVAEALGAAHAVGVVHRDLKPDNVFLLHGEGGFFVKILDFGIAKVMHSGQKLTAVGSVMGTPHYMSPEQATGARTDARTDIYSLGVMMYEMASGKVPFDAENPLAVISMQVTDEPTPLRKRMPQGRALPQGLESVIMKCLAKDPGERFLTMDDVRAALERIAEGGVPLVAPPASAPDAASDSMIDELKKDTDFRELRAGSRRRRWTIRGIIALGVLGGLGGTGFVFRDTIRDLLRPKAPEPVAERVVAAAPVPVPEPPPAAPTPTATAPAVEAPATNKVTLVTFPLDAHVFEGTTDLGLMPVTLEIPTGETKVVRIVRQGYVTRSLKVDGSKARVVVGLVSNAFAKKKGLSQAEAEAEADRAAESSAGARPEKVVLEEDAPAPEPAAAVAKGPVPTAAKPEEKPAAPPAAPVKPPVEGGKTTLAPNPFAE
jgi:serine/threonine-protein kinase